MSQINQIPLPELSVCIRCNKVSPDISGTIIGTFHDYETGVQIDNFYADLCHDCLQEINKPIEEGAPVAISAKSKRALKSKSV